MDDYHRGFIDGRYKQSVALDLEYQKVLDRDPSASDLVLDLVSMLREFIREEKISHAEAMELNEHNVSACIQVMDKCLVKGDPELTYHNVVLVLEEFINHKTR